MITTLSAGMQRKKMNFLEKNVDMSVFGTGEYGKPKLTGVLAGLPAPPKLLRQLRGDWVELESADGEVYFANIKTKETQKKQKLLRPPSNTKSV